MDSANALKCLWTTLLPLILLKIGDVWSASAEGGVIPVLEKSMIHINITEGRTAILPCMVNTLTTELSKKYRVIWVDPKGTVISDGMHIINGDRRLNIMRPFLSDWNLLIKGVRGEDAGTYSCQLNTKPIQQKSVTLYVQVPPTVNSSGKLTVTEGQDVKIYCNVTGTPTPTLTWFFNNNAIPEIKGEVVSISNISRQMAGVFTCLASNGVKPNVTKNITIDVQFAPKAMVYNTRFGQLRRRDTALLCLVVAYPPGEITWYKKGKSLRKNWKYDLETVNTATPNQRYLKVTIRTLEREDYGEYTCVAQNIVGESEVSMTLYELTTPSPTTTTHKTITHRRTTPKQETPIQGDKGDNADHQYAKNTQGGYSDEDGVVVVTDRNGHKNGRSKSSTNSIHFCSYTYITFVYVMVSFFQLSYHLLDINSD